MTDYLVEIGCEEIPARFVTQLLDQWATVVAQDLQKAGVNYSGEIKKLSTYRRLTLQIKDLDQVLESKNETIKGPPLAISKKEDGSFLPPAIGFAKKAGVQIEDLVEEEIDGKIYLVAQKVSDAIPVKDVLKTVIPKSLMSLSLPIAMRWEDHHTTFIRPIHWMVSLFGKDVVPFELFGIEAGQQSYGHRFLSKNKNIEQLISGDEVLIKDPAHYVEALRSVSVLVDPNERRDVIVNTLKTENDPLLEEVINITEYPQVLKGKFNKEYLELPAQVLTTYIKKHQKYFPCEEQGQLSSEFFIVAENVTEKSKENIVKGNEQVLKARLEDLFYFWREDLKQPLSENVEKLKRILFQKELGSVFDKKERLKGIAGYLISTLKCEKHASDIDETIELAKADLVTHMVFEMPELQGVIGRFYAEKQALCSAEVAKGIDEHYKPRFSSDTLAESTTGLIVGLADRLDSLVGCFYAGKIPSGSQDPLGLRRALLGIVRMVVEKGLDLNLEQAFDHTYGVLDKGEKNKDKLIEFSLQRIKGYLLELDLQMAEGERLPYDIVDALLPRVLRDLNGSLAWAKALWASRESDSEAFKLFVETAVRIRRLAQKGGDSQLSSALFKEPIENKAWDEFNTLEKIISTAKPDDQLVQMMALVPTMTLYFDQVLVMDKDEKIKENRLSFLRRLSDTLFGYLDFEALVI